MMIKIEWIAFVTLLLTSGGYIWITALGAGKIKTKVETLENKMGTIETALNNHRDSPTPHISCPAHTEILEEIKESMKEIKSTLGIIDNRVYDLAKNAGLPIDPKKKEE